VLSDAREYGALIPRSGTTCQIELVVFLGGQVFLRLELKMKAEEYRDKFIECMSRIEDIEPALGGNGPLSDNFKRVLYDFGEMLLGIEE